MINRTDLSPNAIWLPVPHTGDSTQVLWGELLQAQDMWFRPVPPLSRVTPEKLCSWLWSLGGDTTSPRPRVHTSQWQSPRDRHGSPVPAFLAAPRSRPCSSAFPLFCATSLQSSALCLCLPGLVSLPCHQDPCLIELLGAKGRGRRHRPCPEMASWAQTTHSASPAARLRANTAGAGGSCAGGERSEDQVEPGERTGPGQGGRKRRQYLSCWVQTRLRPYRGRGLPCGCLSLGFWIRLQKGHPGCPTPDGCHKAQE